MTGKKRFGIAAVIIVCVLVLLFLTVGRQTAKEDDANEMIERIENALGEEYKKQSMTELAATIQYGDKEGHTINYYILKTTYYEASPTEVTGLNTNAISLIVNPETAKSCIDMKIQNWDAALYETDTLSYLCWTDTPEVSYILEYDPDAVADDEIIKMAESAKILNEE